MRRRIPALWCFRDQLGIGSVKIFFRSYSPQFCAHVYSVIKIGEAIFFPALLPASSLTEMRSTTIEGLSGRRKITLGAKAWRKVDVRNAAIAKLANSYECSSRAF